MQQNRKFQSLAFQIGYQREVGDAIQEHLFRIGYTWATGECAISGSCYHWLYTDSKGRVTHGSGLSDSLRSRKVVDVDWMRLPESIQELIELNGKQYDKQELEEALLKLTPVK